MLSEYLMEQLAEIRREEIRRDFREVNRRQKARNQAQIFRSILNIFFQKKQTPDCCPAQPCCE